MRLFHVHCGCSFSQKGSFFAMGFMFLAHPFNLTGANRRPFLRAMPLTDAR